MIAYAMMVLNGITLLTQTARFNNYIREWRRKPTELNMWENFKTFFHQAHREQWRAVITAGKGGYTTAVQNIYSVSPPAP